MATVLFVHGTGVRKAGYEAALERIDAKLNKALERMGCDKVRVEGCLWGDSLGSRPAVLSVPEYRRSGGAVTGLEPKENDKVLLWEMLGYDPLFELRGLALEPANPAALIDINGFKLRVEALPAKPELAEPLAKAGLGETFQKAIDYVLKEGELDRVLSAASSAGQCRVPVAHAVMAAAIDLSTREPPPRAATDPPLRDALVQAVADAILPPDKAPPLEWAVNALFGTAKRLGAMHLVRRQRGRLTDLASAPIADILLYQVRGAKIRKEIYKAVKKVKGADRSVVLLGHSLGGIVCVDLLVMQPLPEVELLVTVGSQAPFLYECNALKSRRRGDPLPATFVRRWVNVYDPRDFLSYTAQGVFPATPGGPPPVADRLVDNGLAFPDAHSGYWDNDETWAVIAPEIPLS